jgi:co-chaperonin GroES (HSP10)
MRVKKKLCTIRPLSNRVIVQRDPIADTTKSGIILAGETNDSPIRSGVIIAMGYLDDDDIEVGNRVIFGRYNGIPVGGEQVVLKEEELLGVIED